MRTRVLVLLLFAATDAGAQGRVYAGAVGGVATISADSRIQTQPPVAASGYKPENGPALAPFFGVHLNNYLSVQASYTWNRNDVRYQSIQGAAGYDVPARTTHQLAIVDALLYFRRRSSWARPYLAAGTGIARLSDETSAAAENSAMAPRDFTDYTPVINVAVGIDVRLHGGWRFRYTFAETIQHNGLSRRLTPPGVRNLAGFRNLFGFLKEF
jgi:Outer membrane protein beta-barrel domain